MAGVRPGAARWGVVAAGLFAAVGLALGVRQCVPAGSPTPRPVAAEPREPVPFSLPVRPEFEATVTAETAPEVAERIAEAGFRSLRAGGAAGRLNSEQAERLRLAAAEHASYVLAGDDEGYFSHVARTGARFAYLEEATDAADREARLADLRESWKESVAAYSLKPVSLEEVTLRFRYIRGEPVRWPDEAAVTTHATSPERWPALSGDPQANRRTIAELMIPVFYAEPPEIVGGVYLGVWFVWDDAARDWRLHAFRLYDPLRVGAQRIPLW